MTDLDEKLIELAENGELDSLPEEKPRIYPEIVRILAAEELTILELESAPDWLVEELHDYWDEESRNSKSGYDYRYDEPDFDYANDDGRYEEDSWAAYGSYVLDH